MWSKPEWYWLIIFIFSLLASSTILGPFSNTNFWVSLLFHGHTSVVWLPYIPNNPTFLDTSSSCFHFCYPFIFNAIFIMMIFYCFSIGSLKKAKELVIFFVIHHINMRNSKLISKRLLQFLKVSSSSNPFKEWTSRNFLELDLVLSGFSFIVPTVSVFSILTIFTSFFVLLVIHFFLVVFDFFYLHVMISRYHYLSIIKKISRYQIAKGIYLGRYITILK